MYEPTDADVKTLLAQMKVDPVHAGAKSAADRLRLLQKALKKAQPKLGKLLEDATCSSSNSGSSNSSPAKLNLSTLNSVNSRGDLTVKAFDVDKMYSVQELFALQHGLPDMHTAWFEMRRTLCTMLDKHVEKGCKRLHLVDSTHPHKMGGTVDFLGARVTPDGKAPVLETRHRFYFTHQVTQDYADMEMKANPHRVIDNVTMEVEPEELKLLAVLFDTNAGCLSPEYVSAQQAAWGTGSHFTPSFLLPIEPLTKEVLLAKCCHVCGAEGAKDCSACRTVAYCSKTCQHQDWKQHKKACREVQAAQAGSSSSVVIDLSAAPDAPFKDKFVTALPTNQSTSQLRKARETDPVKAKTAGSSSSSKGGEYDAASRFVVKVQAPLDSSGMPLYLYDQRRLVVAYISSSQQPAFNSLLQVIRQKGVMGAKLYCWAALDTDTQLRVFTDPLPTQVHSW